MAAQPPAKEPVDTLSKACAYGDLDKVRQFVDADPSCVNKPDENGYFPLQWAALNNRVPEATYLLQKGANVNTADHTGQTALHWAAVRGSLPVLEALLRNNADYEARDNRGYTVCHVAAQYAQTAVLYHLALRWSIDLDLPDSDGRTALHWAAYKGWADTIRLLLVLDARYTLPDKEGCTPLHWAAIKGNGEACTVLLQGGASCVLTYKDVTGSTPAQLAIDKGHRYLGVHLSEYKNKHDPSTGGIFGKNGSLGWLVSTQLCPVLWVLIIGLLSLFMYKVTDEPPGIPLPIWMRVATWSVVIAGGASLVLLYQVTTGDPGFIEQGWESYNKRDGTPDVEQGSGASGSSMNGGSGGASSSSAVAGRKPLLGQAKLLDSPALWAGNWNQLCVTCRIVRPLRAKHCGITNRCVEVFDHFCPWVGNAIGKKNRHLFLAFLWVALYAMVMSATVGVFQIRRHLGAPNWEPSSLVWMITFEVVDIFVGLSVAALAIAQASQIARNVTTNELTNWHRYRYLQSPDGHHMVNPFDRGCKVNCRDACLPSAVPTAPVFLTKEQQEAAAACSGGGCSHSHH